MTRPLSLSVIALSLLALLGYPTPIRAVDPGSAPSQGFSPDEAVKRMQLPAGFTVRAVASEPMIRQPVSMSFDSRGRLWVLQYLQYPNPAGLKAVKQDQYLRTVWDKIPEPPPKGDKGADRITILYDPDEHGVYRKSKDFLTGLNCASGFCIGNGGVYVAQPPYLLFYPDKNEDDVPDGDPEVLLTGFGMEDSHSTANSLQWGPDGWLYGAQGSTVTANIKNPAKPKAAPIEFQQGIWRYHPKTREFELFSEGGGNTWGLDFDKHGQIIAGTNWGGFACLHQMQGAYYIKGFSKHGPLHNPHAYGYLDHIPYKGFKGGHVTCGGIVYQGDAFPEEYRDQYIAGNLLSNAVFMHKLERNGSTFKASHGADLLLGNDTWFRPVDLLQGPDGSVYVADWYDKRAAHLDPVDNWDRTNGRIYKIEYKGTPKFPSFDLRKKSSAELVELLKNPNKWWRIEARRLLAERRDPSVYATLQKWVKEEKGLLALEALWALYVSGGWGVEFAKTSEVVHHANPHVRAWVVRLATDSREPEGIEWYREFVDDEEMDPIVFAQLACSAKRIEPDLAFSLAVHILKSPAAATDPQLEMLAWWAIESAMNSTKVWDFVYLRPCDQSQQHVANTFERVSRRLMAGDIKDWDRQLEAFLDPEKKKRIEPVLRGMLKGLEGKSLENPPAALFKVLVNQRAADPNNSLLLELLFRLQEPAAIRTVRDRAWDTKSPDADRIKALNLLRQTRDEKSFDICKTTLQLGKNSDAVLLTLLAGLEAVDDPTVPKTVLTDYAKWSPAVKKRAVAVLTSRPAWALVLLKAVDAQMFPKADLTLDQVRPMVAFKNADVTKLAEKHWGKIGPATAGEKQARITTLSLLMGRQGLGDPVAGKASFTKHCAACHTLHGEGGKVGPDLTSADRKNRGYLLAQIVDPSGYIRPEYVSYTITTVDGRTLAGVVEPGGGESVTLVNVVDNKPQKTAVPKADIESMLPSPVSLMPEKLLDSLADTEIRDLFAYLQADAGKKPEPAPQPEAKKLKVCLISGSLEYKSDESLATLQKFLEANYPVECVRAFRKSDTDIPGLDALDSCDVAIFFTRRLKPEASQLEHVKKFIAAGKPVVGIRTASHGFQNWLEMDKEIFGGDYRNHYKEGPPTEVKIAESGKDHPVLTGVKPFSSVGSLYKNPAVAKDVTVLLTGTIPDHTEPIAWVRERKVDGKIQRVFYTSLGHPKDFSNGNFTRLVANGLMWTVGREVAK